GVLRKMIHIIDCFCLDSRNRTMKSRAEDCVYDRMPSGNFRPRCIPRGFISDWNHLATDFSPALPVCSGHTAQLFRLTEKIYLDPHGAKLKVARGDKAVASIISLAAKHRNAPRVVLRTIDAFAEDLGNASTRIFHELQARNAEALRGETVDLAHLGSGENSHD